MRAPLFIPAAVLGQGGGGATPPSDRVTLGGLGIGGRGGLATTNHVRDFVDCVKSRKQPRANALAACQTHILAHASYITFQLGRKLAFDPATDRFLGAGSEEANRMRARAMRDSWRI